MCLTHLAVTPALLQHFSIRSVSCMLLILPFFWSNMAVNKHPSAFVAGLWDTMPKAWATKSVMRALKQKHLDQTGSSPSSSPVPCNFCKCRLLLPATPAHALGSLWVLTEECKYVQQYVSVIQSCLWGFAAKGIPELERRNVMRFCSKHL